MKTEKKEKRTQPTNPKLLIFFYIAQRSNWLVCHYLPLIDTMYRLFVIDALVDDMKGRKENTHTMKTTIETKMILCLKWICSFYLCGDVVGQRLGMENRSLSIILSFSLLFLLYKGLAIISWMRMNRSDRVLNFAWCFYLFGWANHFVGTIFGFWIWCNKEP